MTIIHHPFGKRIASEEKTTDPGDSGDAFDGNRHPLRESKRAAVSEGGQQASTASSRAGHHSGGEAEDQSARTHAIASGAREEPRGGSQASRAMGRGAVIDRTTLFRERQLNSSIDRVLNITGEMVDEANFYLGRLDGPPCDVRFE